MQTKRWWKGQKWKRLTGQIRHIADQPDGQKGQGDTLGAARFVIKNKLRDLSSASAFVGPIKNRTGYGGCGLGPTRRKIQVARLMLPKTPDKASWVDNARDRATRAKAPGMAIVTEREMLSRQRWKASNQQSFLVSGGGGGGSCVPWLLLVVVVVVVVIRKAVGWEGPTCGLGKESCSASVFPLRVQQAPSIQKKKKREREREREREKEREKSPVTTAETVLYVQSCSSGRDCSYDDPTLQ
jgi:hypothetical protein